jgi:hypothetical protein
MAQFVDHPSLLLLAVLLCLPVAFPLARFFFDDFDTFKREAGLDTDIDRSIWLLGGVPANPWLYLKVIGFLEAYAAVALAAYQLFTKFL